MQQTLPHACPVQTVANGRAPPAIGEVVCSTKTVCLAIACAHESGLEVVTLALQLSEEKASQAVGFWHVVNVRRLMEASAQLDCNLLQQAACS